jgi:hypothetical protein
MHDGPVHSAALHDAGRARSTDHKSFRTSITCACESAFTLVSAAMVVLATG